MTSSGWFPFLVQANNVPNQDMRAGRQKTPPDAFYNPRPSRQHYEVTDRGSLSAHYQSPLPALFGLLPDPDDS